MISFKINDVKGCMLRLLSETDHTFDSFLLSEAVITTYNTFHIDGHMNKEFFANDEDTPDACEGAGYSTWKTLKPICFSLIKGKRTPLNFKFIFLLSPENTHKFLAQTNLNDSFSPDTINGLILNIKYDGSSLSATTATSLQTFTLDKSLEHEWDTMVQKFFHAHGIDFELL
ncbi:MAG: hypothetical protein GX567_06275 [Clostridia bacterium]|nr:hypothetical protein [Clostridia bacterium]